MRQFIAEALHKSGVLKALDAYWGADRITVLTYHRITHATLPSFDQLRSNVSADPAGFDRQMDYVARHFSVIDLDMLENAMLHDARLPPRPLLLTFDDGYLDNYENAYPILRKYQLPAVIFLMTSLIGQPGMPWWDQCAYAFHHTAQTSADLSGIGRVMLEEPTTKAAAERSMLAALKVMAHEERQQALAELFAALHVQPPSDAPHFMSWDHVRDMAAHRVSFQPHTVSHPRIGSLSLTEAAREIEDSSRTIAAHTGANMRAFAYPFGLPGDYSADTLDVLRSHGISLAFTLTPGPVFRAEAQAHPLEIPRVLMLHNDTFEAFLAKIVGIEQLRDRKPRPYIASEHPPMESRS